MNPLAIVIISAAILIGVVAGLVIANNNKKIFASGAARQNRNYDFYMQEHTFKTNVTDIKALLNALIRRGQNLYSVAADLLLL